jgi:hypothetical protein
MSLAEHAELAGLPRSAVERRLQYGWSIGDALTRPHRFAGAER